MSTTAIALASLALAAQLNGSTGFAPVAFTPGSNKLSLQAEDPKAAEAAVFLPNEPASEVSDAAAPKEEAIELDQVEMLGRGAAKVSYYTSPPRQF